MAYIGKINKLKILRINNFGVFLDGGKDGEIKLFQNQVSEDYKINDSIEVFVYSDSNNHLIATRELPSAQTGEVAYLKVDSITEIGTFLNFGMRKNLFVPFKEQEEQMQEGKYYLVYIYLDEKSNRMAGSTKIYKHLEKEPIDFHENQEVDAVIWEKVENGYKVVIDNRYRAMIYDNEIFIELKIGDTKKGIIKKIRQDNKIDVTLNKTVKEKVKDLSEIIIDKLKQNDGILNITDKSSPEIIKEEFGVSKQTFKKTIGALYKKRAITIEKQSIKLINK